MKGVYIVSESACLAAGTGARKHIDVGLHELRKNFEMTFVTFCEEPAHASKSSSDAIAIRKRSAVYLFFKWMYILLNNHKGFVHYYNQVKRVAPDFIYERSSYLNYNGLIISRLLRIPHMYEVNGITADDNAAHYPDICNWLARRLERIALNSSLGFYVGGINIDLNISGQKSKTIQNGVDRDFLDHFSNRHNLVDGPINIVFIGHAMQHHRLDLLAECLSNINRPEAFRLHLVGNHLGFLRELLPPELETVQYGTLNQEQIKEMIGNMHVSIIPYAKDYFSHVKLFMYAAAKLAIIAPQTRNYKNIFKNREVMFVGNGNTGDIITHLNTLEQNRHLFQEYGQRLYDKVATSFTWEIIYSGICQSIVNRISARHSSPVTA